MIAFYILSPIPSLLARRISDDAGSRNPCKEIAYFITAGIVVSAFGLPIVLARAPDEAPVVSFLNQLLILIQTHVSLLFFKFFKITYKYF